MSIYSELSTLFKLAEKLNELREYPDEDEDENDIKDLASDFFDSCMTILSITAKTEDEDFMRESFLKSHYNLLDWIKNNYCPQNKQNHLENLLCNLRKNNLDNIDMNDDEINLKKQEEINEFNDIMNKEENKENQNDSKISDNIKDSINLIESNYQKNYNNNDINKKINSDFDFNSSTNISYPSKIVQNNNENNNKEDEDYEEEEEEEDDSNEIEEQKQSNKNEDKNEIIVNEENNEIIQDNLFEEKFEIEYNDNEEKNFTNEDEVKEENNEDKEENNDASEESVDENKIKEKENKLKEITSKKIIEYFQLFNSGQNENRNFNNIYMTVKDLIKYYNKFGEKTKEKLLTFICIIFPFCTYNQKEALSIININDENIKEFLLNTLLYFKDFEEYKELYVLLSSTPSKQIKKPNYTRDLKIRSESELIIFYQILIIFKSLNLLREKKDKDSYDKIHFLSFKINFILSHQGLYPCISENILNIFERLLFIKRFYSKAFSMKIEEPFIIKQISQFKDEYKKLSLDKIKNELFDEDERHIYNKVIKSVRHFYKINNITENDLLYYSNNKVFDKNKFDYNFLINIHDMVYQKYNLIKNNLLKSSLNNLEKNIIDLTKKLKRFNNNNNNDKGQYDSYYSFSDKLKRIFNEITSKIKNVIKKEFKFDILNKIKFYPMSFFLSFICFTKFEKDLNIYLDIIKLNNMDKRNIINKIVEYLNKEFKVKKRDNTKYFKIVFEYEEINIKILILRQTLYIKSIILREYSLLDQRFPILMLTLNYFLMKIGFYENSKKYASFLEYLLIAFLQDIINPPILPKLLSKDVINVQNVPLGYKSNEEKINSINYEPMHIPKIIFDKEKIKQIYDEEIGKNKNVLTCSEIFLQFLEFIIYFYKFDSIYVNLSLNFEGFDSINNISNIFEEEDEENNFQKY